MNHASPCNTIIYAFQINDGDIYVHIAGYIAPGVVLPVFCHFLGLDLARSSEIIIIVQHISQFPVRVISDYKYTLISFLSR